MPESVASYHNIHLQLQNNLGAFTELKDAPYDDFFVEELHQFFYTSRLVLAENNERLFNTLLRSIVESMFSVLYIYDDLYTEKTPEQRTLRYSELTQSVITEHKQIADSLDAIRNGEVIPKTEEQSWAQRIEKDICITEKAYHLYRATNAHSHGKSAKTLLLNTFGKDYAQQKTDKIGYLTFVTKTYNELLAKLIEEKQ